MILVTGTSGLVGGAVLRELLATNVRPLRALYRSAQDAARPPAGVEAVRADYADSASLDRALKGVRAAFLVCAPVPELVALESNFLAACQRARTPHVVLQSALGAADFGKSFPSWHRRVEDTARELNVPCTILRPNGFMQNIGGYFAASIRGEDCFYDALGTARVCHIDVRDIAAAAARVLLAPDTIGRAFELQGPEALTNEELASRISRVAGRPVRYVPLTPEQMLQGAIASGMPEERARPVVELYDYYRAGKGVGSDQALRELIGRAPRTVNTYLAEIAASFAKSRPAREEVALAAGFGGFPTLDAAKDFVRNHFEQFVNEKNIAIGSVNFAPDFMDHGADVPPGTPPGPAGAMQYVGNALKKFPDMRVTIEDMVAEGDRVVVRNVWTATEPLQNKRISFRGIVIWRLSNRQLAERWAFLESPRPA